MIQLETHKGIVCTFAGQDHQAELTTVYTRPEVKETSTLGKHIVRRDNVVLAADYDGQAREAGGTAATNIFVRRDSTRDAVARLRKLQNEGRLREWLAAAVGPSSKRKQRALALFSALPMLSPSSLSPSANPFSMLKSCGLWSDDVELETGFRAMLSSPRFFKGRRVGLGQSVRERYREIDR